MPYRPKRIWLGRDSAIRCCLGVPNSCSNVSLLRAQPSEFHSEVLADGTDRINEILMGLGEQAPDGSHLALIDTSMGLLLVWAEAIDPPPDDATDYVSADSPADEIAEMLRIEEYQDPSPAA